MFEFINKLITYVGNSNAISIVLFLICLFVSYYFYFRTFYRIVYSTYTIRKNRISFSNWFNSKDDELNTRILIYNNGRKTLSKDQINKLEIISSNVINGISVIKGIDVLSINVEHKVVKIEFENLDSSDFIVLEIIHIGDIKIKGRVAETGEILNTEPRGWVIVNAIIMIPLLIALFYNLFKYLEKNILLCVLNFIFLLGIFLLLRFIHSLLFIPDRLTEKYLVPKDKFENEFRN